MRPSCNPCTPPFQGIQTLYAGITYREISLPPFEGMTSSRPSAATSLQQQGGRETLGEPKKNGGLPSWEPFLALVVLGVGVWYLRVWVFRDQVFKAIGFRVQGLGLFGAPFWPRYCKGLRRAFGVSRGSTSLQHSCVRALYVRVKEAP